MTAWACALVIAGGALACYAYLGYPLLLALLAPRARRHATAEPADWPAVSIVLPAYNEAGTIARTLETLLATDYPSGRRQILVVSDASTDGTDRIVAGFAGRGVELLRLPERRGKTAAENAACPHLRGAVVVNTDASVRVHPAAVKALVAALLADPTVGVASARDVSVGPGGEDAGAGEGTYVGYEMWVRELETRLGGIVGASGCLYAIRPELHKRIVPDALSRDFGAALVARERGYRSVSVPRAVCFVPPTRSLAAEYRRKVRTMRRGVATLFHHRRLLDPLRHGRFAWMLASHKLCRWLVPWGGVAALTGLVLLAIVDPRARWGLAAVSAGGMAAALGCVWPEERSRPRLLALPAYIAAGSVAALHAWLSFWFARTPSAWWEPTRRGAREESTVHAAPHARRSDPLSAD